MNLGYFTSKQGQSFLGGLLLVLVLGFFLYLKPSSSLPLFWDEAYYVPAAQQFLHNVPDSVGHPPFGIMMIALSEKLFGENERTDHLLKTYIMKEIPKDLVLGGFRVIPIIISIAVFCLLYGLFFYVLRSTLASLFLIFLALFDTALIVHLRGALLEGFLLLGIVGSVGCIILLTKKGVGPAFAYSYTKAANDKKATAGKRRGLGVGFLGQTIIVSLILGICMGIAVTTKFTGWITILCLVAAIWMNPGRRIVIGGTSLAAFVIVYLGIWALYTQTVSPQKPFLSAAIQYQSVDFSQHKSVASLDLCNEEETGSPSSLWPIGGRSIVYTSVPPDEEGIAQYLYMQANPVSWLCSLIGVLFGLWTLLHVLRKKVSLDELDTQLPLFLITIYLLYILALSIVPRSMYLHHYLPMLLIGFLLFALWIRSLKLSEKSLYMSLSIIGILVFSCYQFYRPFTTMDPMNPEQLKARNWLPTWDLRVKDEESWYRGVLGCE